MTLETRNIWTEDLKYLTEQEVQKKIQENIGEFKDYIWTTLSDRNK